MNHRLFARLARQNIAHNRQDYLPYALSCAGLAMMLFVVMALEYNLALGQVYGARTLARSLRLAQWVMLLFIAVFLLYTHSFLIKRRQQEFGLFNILGMEKRHIARVLAIETALVGLASTLAGIALGAITSRLFFLILLRVLSADSGMSMVIPRDAVLTTLTVFAALHALTVARSAAQVHLSKPVQLLYGRQHGEREPRARWLAAALGLALLGAGYALSLTTQPLTMEMMSLQQNPLSRFLWAVLLVIAGTYLLFLAGTVAGLKLMRANPRFYYHPVRFSVVAGLIHRMRRNAVGLASICILSTMVLVMVSATVSLFSGREDLLSRRYARDAVITISSTALPPDIDAQAEPLLNGLAREQKGRLTGFIRYRALRLDLFGQGAPGIWADHQPERRAQERMPFESQVFWLIPAEDYLRHHPGRTLPRGSVLTHADGLPPLSGPVTLNGVRLLAQASEDHLQPLDTSLRNHQGCYTLVAHGEDILAVMGGDKELLAAQTNHVYAFDHEGLSTEGVAYLMDRGQSRLAGLVTLPRTGGDLSTWSRSKVLDRVEFDAVYGGLLFVAIILGGLFVLALVLIIYYKQVSEGYEDRDRFLILMQVGMSREEVRSTIRTQMFTVFYLPLLVSGLHLLAAFPLTRAVLELLSLTNVPLFALVAGLCYLAFALFYVLVYLKTTGSYYRIIRQAGEQQAQGLFSP